MSVAVTIADLIREWTEHEIWRSVAGWPKYEVSTFGRVRRNGLILQASVTSGYSHVSLSDGEIVRTVRIHILVAKTFLGTPPFESAIVAHNDGIKLNCCVGNLRWASARENQNDRIRHGTRVQGSRVFCAKLKEADIPVIRQRVMAGERYPTIAQDYGVSISTICLIKKGRTWQSATGAAWAVQA
jgi:hypothetical protein